MTNKRLQKTTVPVLACATAFVLTAQIQADVMVNFEQFDPGKVTARRSGTLASLGASSFNNTIAWTSSAGDIIRITSAGPLSLTAVPEPSSSMALLGLLISSLGFCRRRK